MVEYYKKAIHFKSFAIRNGVLREVFLNKKAWMAKKLGENWEGPYYEENVTLGGAYILKSSHGLIESMS